MRHETRRRGLFRAAGRWAYREANQRSTGRFWPVATGAMARAPWLRRLGFERIKRRGLSLRAEMSPRGSHISRPREISTVHPRPAAADVAARLYELEQRLAADTRTEAQRWLGDPPPDPVRIVDR